MERDTLREIVLAALGVVVFVGGLLAVSQQFGGPDFAQDGGFAVVAVLALFLVVMAVSGFWLSTRRD